jgi:hypothetical protein
MGFEIMSLGWCVRFVPVSLMDVLSDYFLAVAQLLHGLRYFQK